MKGNILLSIVLIFNICCSNLNAQQAYGAIPTPAQIAWHEMEYFSLVCYGLNTYTEQEWAYGDVDPKLFNPSNLDTDQWARVAKEAGMKGLILVAKHHDGFCLWPSKYTKYSVAATPWKNGKGHVLGDLSKSCKKYGLKLGVYLSPWDRNHADYGKPAYVKYYYDQLEELMTQYGEVFEFWIDGANGGTGYYGGANDRRDIDRLHYYGYDSIFAIVKKHHPNASIFSDVGPEARWVGNEDGIGSITNWNTITTEGKFPGESSPDFIKKLGTGEENGKNWVPAEVNTTLLWPKAWYFHTGMKPRSLNSLVDLYYTSIGRGGVLDLGIAIAPSGEIREEDKNALLKFKKHMDREFANNLVKQVSVSATDERSGTDYQVKNITDSDNKTYWATNDHVKEASIMIDFGKETIFNRFLLQEAISLGQRVYEFKLEKKTPNGYELIAEGTTIGYKRVLKFEDVKASEIRLTLKTNAPCLTLSNIGLYNAPLLVDDPIPSQSIHGELSFQKRENIAVYYKIGNENKKSGFIKYTKPVYLPDGGKIYSYAKDEKSGYKTDEILNVFGVAKVKWNVVSVDGVNNNETKKIVDNDPNSFFKTDVAAQQHSLIIDLKATHRIRGFSYLPRQDGEKEGTIFEYEFFVSQDGKNWGAPVDKGSFQNIENNPIQQVIKFKKEKPGRFVKLVSKSTIRQDQSVSFAEIDVFTK